MTETFKVNEIKVNSIVLINNNGSLSNDITDLVSEIDIFESVYTNAIVGSIKIIDSNDLIQFFPMIGKEYLSFDFLLPGLDDSMNWALADLQVYKISDRQFLTDKVQTYTLWFTTGEAITNTETRVVKSWKGKTVDVIINDIFRNSLGSSKTLNIPNKPTGYQSYVSPAWYPFKVINYLCENRTIDSHNLADYVFFENITPDAKSTQFNFVALSALTKQNPVATFTYQIANLPDSKGNNYIKPFNIEKIIIENDINTIKLREKGLYNQTVMYYDPLRKRVVTSKLNYRDIYLETSEYKLGKNSPVINEGFTPGLTEFFMVNEFPLKSSSDKGINTIKNVIVDSKPKRNDEEYISENGETEYSTMTEKVFSRRKVLMNEFDMFKVTLHGVSGNYFLYTVGRVVKFDKPHIVNNRDSVAESMGTNEDILLSGNYLITRNRHRITKERGNFQYKNYIEISKNSFI